MKHRNFEMDYVRACRKVHREMWGFETPKTHSSKKDYSRGREKAAARRLIEECCC